MCEILDIVTVTLAIGIGIWAIFYSVRVEKLRKLVDEDLYEARRIIAQIATDRPELSQENIRVQRNQNQIECKKWMEKYGH